MRASLRSLVLSLSMLAASWPLSLHAWEVAEPRTEYSVNPLMIDQTSPRLSWRVVDSTRGARQTAYRVLVASTAERLAADDGDLWDSGKVASSATAFVAYAGRPLTSTQRVFWKVRAWNERDEASGWSEPAQWTMGLLTAEEWKAKWICAPWTTEGLLLRKEFSVKPGLVRALLHVCGLGQYEVNLNGAKVGNDLLSPGWTNYDRTTLYDSIDVTARLGAGENALGLTLGNGMYHVTRRHRFAKFTNDFGPLRAIVQLELSYADGSVQRVLTDETWRVDRGAIVFNSIYGGEDVDARLQPSGWDRPGFDDRSWTPAVAVNRPSPTLRGHSYAAEPLRVIEYRSPVSVREVAGGADLYDIGQNMSLMPRLRVRGPKGSTVRITPGEVVDDNGVIDRGTMGGAHRGSAWWQYTKATDEEETYFPQFYYVGSRYFSVERLPAVEGGAKPEVVALDAALVHSIARPLGTFATSNPLLNQIRDLVRWAQRSNMVSVLTDCPHREKLGWIEQYHLNGPSIRYEFDVARIYTKGMHDMAASQTEEGLIPNITPEYTEFKGAFRNAAEWGASFILVPWQQYVFNGDSGLMRTHYGAMQRYFTFLESRIKDGLLSDGLGDWYDLLLPKKGRANLTPAPITATAFLYEDARILAETATILGKQADAARYRQRAEEIKARYNREFFKADGPSYGTDSQASLAIPLVMGLAPEEARPGLLAALVKDVEEKGYATAGDIGFRYLLRALADGGRSDVIYRLINQSEKPGYGYQIKQGATSLTESWDASRGASHNHFMLGQVIEWFYHDLAGIQPMATAPGFAEVAIKPAPVGDLTWVEASYESIRGPIKVRWERAGERFTLRLTVPANAKATVYLPSRAAAEVREGGSAVGERPGITLVRQEGDRTVLGVASGDYVFESRW